MPAGSGCILLDSDVRGTTFKVKYHKKCEACGYVDRTVIHYGSVVQHGRMMVGTFHCPKCHASTQMTLWG